MSDAPRLYGTRAIVTAASDGIGEAIVRILIKNGAEVVAIDDPSAGVAQTYTGVKNVVPLSGKAVDKASAEALLKEARDEMGGIDVVINNAFLQPKTQIGDDDGDALEQLIEQKINRYSLVARSALQYLQQSPAGRIVNIGCLRSAFTINGSKAFRASERALAELTAALAVDAAPNGINVTYLQPGAIMTHASRRIFNADKDFRDYCIRTSAAGRVGEPVDVAKAVLFLASDDSVFVTGTGLIVDGGARSAA